MICFVLRQIVLLLCLVRLTSGVPVARMMGCGISEELPMEKKKFCCEHFNLDCPDKVATSISVGVSARSSEPTEQVNTRDFAVRLLGEECKQLNDKCAIGLHCRHGLCVRRRSASHLRALMDRGKLVEKEEREAQDAEPGTDEEDGDPLPAQKGLILQGQAVKKGDSAGPDSLSGHESGPRITPTPERRQSFPDEGGAPRGYGIEELSTDQVNVPTKPLMEEEDELAANIADLLSSKLGVSLDNVEMHSIRELIAGTIDERAEREDEAAEYEDSIAKNENRTDQPLSQSEKKRVKPSRSNVRSGQYEPLLQCAADGSRDSAPDSASDIVRKSCKKVDNYVHVDI